MCQADKNILCQRCEERRTAVQMRQAPPHCLRLLTHSIFESATPIILRPGSSVQGRPRTHIARALPYIRPRVSLTPSASVWKKVLCTEAALYHHGYRMRRNRGRERKREKRQKQGRAAQELTMRGLKETGPTEVRSPGPP